MIWLFVWLALAVMILTLTFWTYAILFKQKGIWASFAERHNLKLIKTGLLHSPQIDGQYKELPLQIFSERQTMPDGRGHQYRTVIQFVLEPNMPTDGVISSRYFTPFVENLGIPKKWKMPKDVKWGEEPIARAAIAARLKTFLTNERLKALETLSNIKKSSFVFIFDESDAYLRVESPDPLDEGGRMDKIVSKIHSIAAALAVKEEEVDAFNELAKREERIDHQHTSDEDDDDDDDDEDDEE